MPKPRRTGARPAPLATSRSRTARGGARRSPRRPRSPPEGHSRALRACSTSRARVRRLLRVRRRTRANRSFAGVRWAADARAKMKTVLLPNLSLWLDEQTVDFETLLSFVDGRAMMLNTFVPSELHELHSSYVDTGEHTVVASHLLVPPGMAPEPSSETLDSLDLSKSDDRRHCLLGHLAILRDALEQTGVPRVRLEVGDQALRAADRPQ